VPAYVLIVSFVLGVAGFGGLAVFEFLEGALRSAHRVGGLVGGGNPHFIRGGNADPDLLATALVGGLVSDVGFRRLG
jgi:hypothetical protein